MTPLSPDQHLQFEYRGYRRRFRKALKTAHGEWPEREGVVIRLSMENGRTGYGEIAPIPWFSPELARQLANQPLPEALGLDRIGKVVQPTIIKEVAEPTVRWAFECAVTQLVDPTLPGVRVPIAGLLPAGEAAVGTLSRQLASGRRAYKWKIGVLPCADELALANQLMASLPRGVRLRFDANCGLGDDDYAAWLSWCTAHRHVVDYIEQPLPVGREQEMFDRAKGMDVPIALDESIAGVESLIRLAGQFPQAVLIVKPSLLGSRGEYLRWRTGHPRNRVVYSTGFETAIGLKAVWELAALDWPPLAPAGLDASSALEEDGLCPLRIGWELCNADWPNGLEHEVWDKL
ncbi:o-succinylbenzoate synthase [Cerasicoccus fimbriatus]|uniref:o-succinylbenzoate synthase n=1 Tax=Cerasicoccus fimbriatus TaxID=3014554 RepID=UPI0022B3A3D6|nr:o-succinylbenzoate synthase [Cerasicoccus sp. TK19100]